MKKDLFTKITCIILLAIIVPIGCFVTYQSLLDLRENKSEVVVGETIFDKEAAAISYLNNQYNDNMPFEMNFIEINGIFQRVFNRHYIEDVSIEYSIVKDNYGQLNFTGYWQTENVFDTKTLPGLMDQVMALKGALDTKNIPLLYIAAPEKIISGRTELPLIINNYANAKVDSMLAALSENNIPYFDLRKTITENTEDNPNDLFYTTDHHWKSRAAFAAAYQIADYLNQHYGMNIDPNHYYGDINNYDGTYYDNFFVGSQGRRVGKYYAGTDDFELLLPKFATNYTLTYLSGSEKTRRGNFKEALIFEDYLAGDDVYTNRYAAYLGGDHALMTITNNDQDNYKILIVKDSFTAPAASFLSTAVSELKLVDLRYYKNSLIDLALEYEPDIVIVLYSSGGLSDTMFDFDKVVTE